MWKQEPIPLELKDTSIVPLYKRKKNRQTCDDHRGISLLSIAGKILARVLLNRLIDHLEDGLLSMRIQNRAWHSGYDLCSASTPRKVSRTERRSLHNFCKP